MGMGIDEISHRTDRSLTEQYSQARWNEDSDTGLKCLIKLTQILGEVTVFQRSSYYE